MLGGWNSGHRDGPDLPEPVRESIQEEVVSFRWGREAGGHHSLGKARRETGLGDWGSGFRGCAGPTRWLDSQPVLSGLHGDVGW